jgi:hypothetical protein
LKNVELVNCVFYFHSMLSKIPIHINLQGAFMRLTILLEAIIRGLTDGFQNSTHGMFSVGNKISRGQ